MAVSRDESRGACKGERPVHGHRLARHKHGAGMTQQGMKTGCGRQANETECRHMPGHGIEKIPGLRNAGDSILPIRKTAFILETDLRDWQIDPPALKKIEEGARQKITS